MYGWKKGVQIKLDPELAGSRLEYIRDQNKGRLTPEVVLEDARPEDSPLHPAFEWDDTVAAERYRKNQAQAMIQAVVIVASENRPEVRAFVSVVQADDQGHTYTHILHAMDTPALREQVIENAKHDLEIWENKYQDLTEFASVHEAIKHELSR